MIGQPRDFAEALWCLESLTRSGDRGRSSRHGRQRSPVPHSNWPCWTPTVATFGEPMGRTPSSWRVVAGLRRFAAPGRVRYGAAITADSWFKELRSAIKFYVYRFRDVKTKVGVAGQDDVRTGCAGSAGCSVRTSICGLMRTRPGTCGGPARPGAAALAVLARGAEQPVPHAEVRRSPICGGGSACP